MQIRKMNKIKISTTKSGLLVSPQHKVYSSLEEFREEILNLSSKTKKLEPARLKALLDMGYKPIYEVITESGRAINTTGNHPYLVRFGGYTLNPNALSVYNLPLNSEGLTDLNKYIKDENTVLINGGLILMNTMPEYFSGGNKKILPKCLSKDKIILPSDLASLAIPSSSERKGASFTSNPSFFSNSTTLAGTFSSENSFNLLEDDIFFLFNQLGGIIQSREDVFFSESGEVISNDFFWCNPSSQQIKNLPYHNPSVFESWFTMTDLVVNDNMLINFDSHNVSDDNKVFKGFGEWFKVKYLKEGMEIAVPDYETRTIKWDKIVPIKILEPQQVYDIEAEGTHNFIANDIIAHNIYLKGRVGMGIPAHALEVAGSMNISNDLNVSGLCVAGDTLLSMADGSKKKIVDVKADEYVLSLNEETGKIEPHRIIGLLDMGVKPIYELTTATGRSINTTGNHPYLTPDGWIKVVELSAGNEIAVPRMEKIGDYFTPNNFLRSSVETTLTLPCCLCLFSSDHNSNLSEDNAKAKYGASLACAGNISRASGINLEYFDSGIISIFLNSRFITNSSSAFVSPEYFNNLSSLFLISFDMNSGEYSLMPALDNFFIKRNMNPLLINAYTMFASTTNIILECQKCPAFLSMLQNLRFSTYQEDIPCLLAMPDFTSSANLNACSFVNLLLDTILSAKENSTSSMNSFITLFNANSKSSFNSGEISTLNFNSAIPTSPNKNNEEGYLKLSSNFKIKQR